MAAASARVLLRSAALLAACSCAASGATRTPRVCCGRIAPFAQPRRARSRGAACTLLDCAVTSRGRCVATQAPQAGAPITVWVKRTDVTGARYVAVKGVDVLQTVDDFIANWVAQAKLDVDPSLVTLRLVESSAADPTPDEEAIAKNNGEDLGPRLTLAGAGIKNGSSLLAFTSKSAPLLVFAPLEDLSVSFAQVPRYPKRLWLHVNLPCVSWTLLCSRWRNLRPR